MNLRPPGPQPGALPDCATPRDGPVLRVRRCGGPSRERATGIEPALELGRLLCNHYTSPASGADDSRAAYALARRSSVGTSPSSSTSDGGGQGPNQLSRAPSSVITEPRQRAAERRGGERDEPGVLLLAAEALERDRAGGARADGLGVLAQRLGVEVAGGEREHGDRRRPPTRARARACSPRRRRGRRSSASCPVRPWCGESVMLTIVPPPAGRIASSRGDARSSLASRRRSAASPPASPSARSPRRARSTGRRRC